MRILDDVSDKKLDEVSILLTYEEAEQLHGYLGNLLENPKLQHEHMSSSDCKKTVTLCLYDESNLDFLHPRAIKLIKEDE
ncbi:MAG: hypothetical protein ACOYK9_05755 [Chlamydiia bacterium]